MPRRGGNLPIRDKIYMALKLHETLNLPIPDNFPKPRNQVKRLNSVSDTTFLSPPKVDQDTSWDVLRTSLPTILPQNQG